MVFSPILGWFYTHDQTGSWCLDKAVLVCDTRYQKNTCPENLPIPHPKHNNHNRALKHNV